MPDVPATTDRADPRLRIDSSQCTWRSLGEQVIVLDLAGSAYFELNHSAARLWPALVDGTDDTELTRILTDLGSADAAADVRAFLDQLRTAGLLLPEQPHP